MLDYSPNYLSVPFIDKFGKPVHSICPETEKPSSPLVIWGLDAILCKCDRCKSLVIKKDKVRVGRTAVRDGIYWVDEQCADRDNRILRAKEKELNVREVRKIDLSDCYQDYLDIAGI